MARGARELGLPRGEPGRGRASGPGPDFAQR